MQVYLVGGAVRDRLLGLPIKERDWVVVGASVADMLRLGFKPVGKDFPVFLHPITKEEYALARTERKVGRGYAGFVFNTSPEVTLEEDLKRRDLTINAMAETLDGKLIDPFHGQEDLLQKKLRHVSDAFVEDPVRILRVGRFAARYAQYGFELAHETLCLMQKLVASGEIQALVSERVWKEFERALGEQNPEQFFVVLSKCGALEILFPEINYSGKGMAALKRAVLRTHETIIRFAVLLHDIDPGAVQAIANRYRAPKIYRELALLVAQNLEYYLNVASLPAEEVLKFLQKTDAFRREKRFKQFLLAAEMSSQQNNTIRIQSDLQAAKQIDIQAIVASGLNGKALANKISEMQIKAIETARST